MYRSQFRRVHRSVRGATGPRADAGAALDDQLEPVTDKPTQSWGATMCPSFFRIRRGHIPSEPRECMQEAFSVRTIQPTSYSPTAEGNRMTTYSITTRRLILAGGFALTIAIA